jgi:hypothetical protein
MTPENAAEERSLITISFFRLCTTQYGGITKVGGVAALLTQQGIVKPEEENGRKRKKEWKLELGKHY